MVSGESVSILGVRTHPYLPDGRPILSAVDWWRVENPLAHLKKKTGWDIKTTSKVYDESIGGPEEGWASLGREYNIMFSSYIDNPTGYAWLKAARDQYGLEHVMDLDDDIYDVAETSPVYREYNPESEKLKSASIIANDVDTMIVTTPYLKKTLEDRGRTKPTIVIPNAIDLELFKFPFERKWNGKKRVKFVYYGSNTHRGDILKTGFMEAMRRICREYGDRVRFKFIGQPHEELISHVKSEYQIDFVPGQSGIYSWLKIWKRELEDIDVGLALLVDDEFNRCKSNIKWQELAAAKIPCIATDICTYNTSIENGKNGLLAENTPAGWYRAMKTLIDLKELRLRMGERAYQDVDKKWEIRHQVDKYEEVFYAVFSGSRILPEGAFTEKVD